MFGETLIVKLTVLEKMDDMAVFKRVRNFVEKNKDSKYSFEEALNAFRSVGYDEVKAIDFIHRQRQFDAIRFAEANKANNESMFKDDDNDDLYS